MLTPTPIPVWATKSLWPIPPPHTHSPFTLGVQKRSDGQSNVVNTGPADNLHPTKNKHNQSLSSGGGGFFLARKDFGSMLDESFPANTLGEGDGGDISWRAPISLFRSRSVQSGSAGSDDCGHTSPDTRPHCYMSSSISVPAMGKPTARLTLIMKRLSNLLGLHGPDQASIKGKFL